MYKNDYHQKSIGKLVTLPFTAKVQGKWWKYKSNKLCLHPLNIPSLDIIPVSEMIYFFTMNSIPWRRGGIKKVHYQTYIIKHQRRWFSEVTLRYGRGLGILYLHPSDYFKYINEFNFITNHFTYQQLPLHSTSYFDWISGYSSSTVHNHITLLQHITCTKFATGDPICTGIPSQKIQYCWHVIAGLLHIL